MTRPNLRTIKAFVTILCLGLGAGHSTAQGITVTGKTRSLIGALADADGNSLNTRSMPANTALQSSISVVAASGPCSSMVLAAVAPNKASFKVNCIAQGSSKYGEAGVYTDPTALDGEIKIGFHFSSPQKVSGRLLAVMKFHETGFVWGALADGIATVRVAGHDDAVCDSWFDIDVTREFGVELDSKGIDVEVGIECWGISKAQMKYGMEVELYFVPGHKVNAYGVGCAHLHSMFPSKHQVDIYTRSATAQNLPTLFAIGFQKAKGTLGGPMGCPVLLQPVTIIAGPNADLSGTARLSLPLPNDNFTILAQGAFYVPLLNQFMTTNALEMEIKKR